MFGRSDDDFWAMDMTQFEALCEGHARYHGHGQEQDAMSAAQAITALKREGAGRKRDGSRSA